MRFPIAIAGVILAGTVWAAAGASPQLKFTELKLEGGLTGDVARGADAYDGSCSGCHSLDANRVGPAHRGVVGRIAGTAADYAYSPALKAAGFVWTPDKLDAWLTNPQALVPGAKMGFRLGDAQSRADVIAYLADAGAKGP